MIGSYSDPNTTVNQYVQMSQSSPIAEKLVPKSEITATATSEQSGERANKAIDGNTSTVWHTPWEGVDIARNPQSITLNLGKIRNVSSVAVTPRQSGDNNGKFKYKIYAGDTLIKQGTWVTDSAIKYVYLDESVTTDCIRIEAISTIGYADNKYASIAEIDVYEVAESPSVLVSSENIKINSGAGGSLSKQLENVLGKEEGTAIIRFQTTGSGFQSLFSISNNTRANEYFHLYINGEQIGYGVYPI